jgi:hypothetical protein
VSTFQLRLKTTGSGFYQDGGLTDMLSVGGDLPQFAVTRTQTGVEVWQQVMVAVSLAASASLDIDLADPANTLLDRVNRPLNLSKLYYLALAVTSPAGTKSLRVGPQNVTSGAQLWFSGVGAGAYEVVDQWVQRPSFSGWTVTAGGARVLRINNPSAVTVAGTLYLAGKQ